jgi:predicted O-methyltransferase YrrM
MKFAEIAKLIKGIPYTSMARGKLLYDHILLNRPCHCLELGFAHGVASCYIVAALHEIGSGHLTCADLESSKDREPNLEQLLKKADLEKFVSINREKSCYTWFLKN